MDGEVVGDAGVRKKRRTYFLADEITEIPKETYKGRGDGVSDAFSLLEAGRKGRSRPRNRGRKVGNSMKRGE